MLSLVNIFKKNLRNLMHFFGIRNFYIQYVVYNKVLMKALSAINTYRWKNIDLVLIVWPPALSLLEEINSYIAKHYEILSFKIIKIDDEKFEDFIYELYEIDFANPRKVALKIDMLLSCPEYRLGVIYIRIPRPEMIVLDAFNRVKCESIGDLKDNIRKKFKNRIANYVYDVIVHSTEVNYQNKKVIKVINKYSSQNN